MGGGGKGGNALLLLNLFAGAVYCAMANSGLQIFCGVAAAVVALSLSVTLLIAVRGTMTTAYKREREGFGSFLQDKKPPLAAAVAVVVAIPGASAPPASGISPLAECSFLFSLSLDSPTLGRGTPNRCTYLNSSAACA